MIVSIRVNDSDAELIKCFADHNGFTISGLIRIAVMEYIEKHYLEALQLKEVSEEENYYTSTK